jgi:polysaccharide deacetylase family protein (PEP-CTERM system associated)
LTPDEFRDDLRRSRDVLEEIIGKPITAYRAPSFSIDHRSMWALETLVEEGFTVDSSLLPTSRNRLENIDEVGRPFTFEFNAGKLVEFPLAVCRLGRRVRVPISGGGYFRFYPLPLTTRLLRRVNNLFEAPFTFYIHPWEFDPAQPRLKAGSLQKRFRHYVNLSKTEARFEKLLQSFEFGRMDEVLSQHAVCPLHQISLEASLAT